MIMGLQWGDEGKGRVVDTVAASAHSVVRFNGGPNAGHTIPLEGGKNGAVHQLPSGAYQTHTKCVMGGGMVIDPEKLIKEIADVGLNIRRLYIDCACHIVFPCHKSEDGAAEESRGDKSIGTTKTGNGPAYSDKYSRSGVRLDEFAFTSMATLRESVYRLVSSRPGRDLDALTAWAIEVARLMEGAGIFGRMTDVPGLLYDDHNADRNILFECAHGFALDIDHGAYPYVTSSSCGIGGVYSGAGFDPREIRNVIGVMKPYSTRIGAGPFVPGFGEELDRDIREIGGEYGVTTGRPRRIGILDLSQVRLACHINGVDSLALTHMDIADYMGTVPFIDVNGARDKCAWHDLIGIIETRLNRPIRYMSTGPKRGDMEMLWGEDGVHGDLWGL
jgi:adenylosuccinate synthase